MNDLAYLPPPRPAAGPLDLGGKPLFVKLGAVLLGTLVLTLASRITVPMFPVPMTMQTLAVTLIGALYGWRLGTLTVLAWLAEAAIGLPVLSNGNSGLAYFMGATGGYLLAFPCAAALVGWLSARGWNAGRPALSFAAMLLGNALCLVLGAGWLSLLVGVEKAVMVGVVPFVLGGIVKSGLGAAIVVAASRLRRVDQRS